MIQTLALTLSLFAAQDAAPPATDVISLHGLWGVRLDPQDVGFDEGWATARFEEALVLPTSLTEAGFGESPKIDSPWIGNVRQEELGRPRYRRYLGDEDFHMPFWLTPKQLYVGAAWYRRDVEIPESWKGQRILLTLERPHFESRVWLDGRELGSNLSLSTPHVYELGSELTPGRHQLAVRVDNRLVLDVGPNSHSVSDHTQSNWNGIVGRIELRAVPTATVQNIQVFPARDGRSARVTGRTINSSSSPATIPLCLQINHEGRPLGFFSRPVKVPAGGGSFEFTIRFEREAPRWDEFEPRLCTLTVSLGLKGDGPVLERIPFGLRHVETKGTRILLNGRPIFLRGTLECCIFPLTGYPPTDVASWERIIGVCKAHGLNHIRFHSWCPPEAAFTAADRLGFYFQVECSTWPNQGVQLGVGQPIDDWLYAEGERIIEAYGNHPSFLLFASGNEPAGPGGGGVYLGPWVEHFQRDERRLVTSASGWPLIEENDFHVSPQPRIQRWGEGLNSSINAQPPNTLADYHDYLTRFPDQPVVSHEIGQWCVYPDLTEIEKYTGVLQARNFEIFRGLLDGVGMLDQARDFLLASGKLQTLCYKADIEAALRTPGFGGFQLLDLHDFPGQGSALVGVLDPFWDSKPYVTPEQFHRFCAPVTPLARLEKRVFYADEVFKAGIKVAHFGPAPLENAVVRWRLEQDGEVLASRAFPARTLEAGELHEIGAIGVSLSEVQAPAALHLVVGVEGCEAENDWKVWVYPREVSTSGGPRITRTFDRDAVSRLARGGSVLLLVPPTAVRTDVALGFSSIFWNTAWTGGQSPHTLGILCDPEHPALAGFPTDFHSDWQWWELIHGAAPMELDRMPEGLRPIVQVVPDWFDPIRLGLAFEARVENGRLLVVSMDLERDLDQRPVARQLRRSLLDYMDSEAFAPEHKIHWTAIRSLLRPLPAALRVGATVSADSAHSAHSAEYAIDGRPETIWHSDWEGEPAPMPHALTLVFPKPLQLAGLTYRPRQDMSNGRLARYEVEVSENAVTWTPVAEGEWGDDAERKTIRFERSVTARFLRLRALSEVNGQPYASAAEVQPLLADGTAEQTYENPVEWIDVPAFVVPGVVVEDENRRVEDGRRTMGEELYVVPRDGDPGTLEVLVSEIYDRLFGEEVMFRFTCSGDGRVRVQASAVRNTDVGGPSPFLLADLHGMVLIEAREEGDTDPLELVYRLHGLDLRFGSTRPATTEGCLRVPIRGLDWTPALRSPGLGESGGGADASGPHEVFTRWPDGAPLARGTVDADGLRQGTWTTWWSNENKRSEGTYEAGFPVGEWRYWREDGVASDSVKHERPPWLPDRAKPPSGGDR